MTAKKLRYYATGILSLAVACVVFVVAVPVHYRQRVEGQAGSGPTALLVADRDPHVGPTLVAVIEARDYMLITAFVNSIILTCRSR